MGQAQIPEMQRRGVCVLALTRATGVEYDLLVLSYLGTRLHECIAGRAVLPGPVWHGTSINGRHGTVFSAEMWPACRHIRFIHEILAIAVGALMGRPI